MNLGSKSTKNPKPLSESDPLRDEKIRMILHIVCSSEAALSSTQIANKMKTKFDYDTVYIYKLIEKLSPIWDFYSYSDYKYRYPTPIRFLCEVNGVRNTIAKECERLNALHIFDIL